MIGQKAALMMANMVVGTILGLAAAILVGRFFHPSDVGQFNYALSLVGLLFFVTDLGMGQAHVKRVSEGRDPGDCFATYTAFKIVSTLVFVSLVGAGVFVYLVVLQKPLVSTTLPIILVIVGYYVAKALADVGQSSFDARLETAKAQSASLADTLVRIVLTIWFALVMATLVHHVLDLRLASSFGWVAENPGFALAVATLAGSITAAAVSLTLLARTLERGRFRWELLKDYTTFAFPLFVSSSIVLFAAYVDAATLGFFRSDAEAGIFSAVRRLPLVLAGAGTALSALLFPAISSMAARHDHEGVQRTTDGALRYLSLLLVPAVAFTVTFPTDLIHITLGDQWLAGAAALALLSVAVVVTTLGHAHSFLLLGHGHARAAAKVGIASAIVLILLNLALVPDDLRFISLPLAGMGVTGAALATVISSLVYYVGLRVATQRMTGYRERNHMWYHLGAAVLMAGGLALLDRFLLPLARWYHVPMYATLGVALYFALLWAWGEITREDVTFVGRTLHPGDMLRYIRNEIQRRRE